MDSIKLTIEIPYSSLEPLIIPIVELINTRSIEVIEQSKSNDAIIDNKKVMELLSISRATLYRFRDIGLPCKMIGGKSTYVKGEVLDWYKNYKA